MAIDRSKLKATKLSDAQAQENEHNQIMGTNSRAGFIDLKKGENKFRIFPVHPDSKIKTFYQPKTVHWLTCILEDKDTGVKAEKRKAIFNSKVHGGTPKDIIEEYQTFCEYMLSEEIKDTSELKAKLEPFNHFKTKITGQTSWIMYVNEIVGESKNFGRCEVTNGTKDKMNELFIEDEDEAIKIDPYTDPDEGICVIIHYNPDAKDKNGNKDIKNIYRVELDAKKSRDGLKYIKTPLTDEDVEKFFASDSLESMYKNAYKKSDFQLALNGLKVFDKKHDINLIEHDDFLAIIEEISAYYSDDDDIEEPKSEKKTKTSKKKKVEEEIESDIQVEEEEVEEVEEIEEETPEEIEEEVSEEDTDILDDLDRNELKAFIRDNKLSEKITIYKSMTEDNIRDEIRENFKGSLKKEKIVADAKKEEKEEKETDISKVLDKKPGKVEEESTGKPLTAMEKLAALREKAKK